MIVIAGVQHPDGSMTLQPVELPDELIEAIHAEAHMAALTNLCNPN